MVPIPKNQHLPSFYTVFFVCWRRARNGPCFRSLQHLYRNLFQACWPSQKTPGPPPTHHPPLPKPTKPPPSLRRCSLPLRPSPGVHFPPSCVSQLYRFVCGGGGFGGAFGHSQGLLRGGGWNLSSKNVFPLQLFPSCSRQSRFGKKRNSNTSVGAKKNWICENIKI